MNAMGTQASRRQPNSRARRQSSVLLIALALVAALFIGILVMVYVVSKRANPVLLDEIGKPVNAESARDHQQSQR